MKLKITKVYEVNDDVVEEIVAASLAYFVGNNYYQIRAYEEDGAGMIPVDTNYDQLKRNIIGMISKL